jgi:TRAP-type C4-dicarboxylate transport system permease small subunit
MKNWSEDRMRALKFLDAHFEEILVITFLATMTALVGVQVIMRYVMQSSLSWSEEMARYVFIWLVNIGISYGVKTKRHISVDVLNYFLSKKKSAYLSILADILFLVFSIIVVYNGYNLTLRIMATGQASPALEMPMYVVYGSLPASFCLVCVRLIQSIVIKIMAIADGKYEELV